MKKIYLGLTAVLLASAAMAQGPVRPIKDNVHAKQPITQAPHHQTHVNADNNERMAIYSFDFTNTGIWSMSNTSNPNLDWSIVTQTSSTLQGQGFDAAINSTSGGNFAFIDSDAAGQTATQNADLQLDSLLDFSAVPAVIMEFTNYHRRFQEQHMVRVSNDGGSTWTDFLVNDLYVVNTNSPNSELVSLNITSVAGGQDSVMIQFNYQGAWDWFWCVDDVEFFQAPDHEVSLISGDWAAFGINYTKMPSDQIGDATFQSQTMNFMGVLNNGGANAETNAQLTVDVTDPGSSSIFTGTGLAATIPVGGTYQDTLTTGWTGATGLGEYRFNFGLTYDMVGLDDDPSADTTSHPFWVTDNEYARDYQDRVFNGGGLWNGAGDPYIMGPVYDMYATRDITIIRAGLQGNTVAGVSLYGQIYQIDQSTGDFVLVYDGSGTLDGEFVVQSYMLSGTSVTWVNIPIDGGSFTMQQGESYIVCVGHYGGGDDALLLNGGNVAPEQTVFILDGTDNTWYYMTSTPTIRAVFDPKQTIGIDEEEASMTLGQNQPNPFNGVSLINYSLVDAADVTFEVTDVTGKIVERMDLGTVLAGEHQIELNADKYAKGAYFYTLTAGQERLTKRMVVTK